MSKRFENFHKQFENLNITKKLEYNNNLVVWKYDSLNETKRIASIIKERIIKEDK
jgi:mitochondrial fission protein ELM1